MLRSPKSIHSRNVMPSFTTEVCSYLFPSMPATPRLMSAPANFLDDSTLSRFAHLSASACVDHEYTMEQHPGNPASWCRRVLNADLAGSTIFFVQNSSLQIHELV